MDDRSPRSVIVEPPSDEILGEIARLACEELKCPQARYDFALFLKFVAKMQAKQINARNHLDKPKPNA